MTETIEIEKSKLERLVRTLVRSVGRTERSLIKYDDKEAFAVGQMISIVHDNMAALDNCSDVKEIQEIAQKEFHDLQDNIQKMIKKDHPLEEKSKDSQSYIG